MVMVPPPRSERIGAEELPSVTTLQLSAVRVPPPVTMMPPELLELVLMETFEAFNTPVP